MNDLNPIDGGVPEIAGIGDNLPDEGLRSGPALTAHIADTHASLFKRAHELIAAESRLPPIMDEETDAKATEFVKLIQACEKGLDQARLNEKAPYDLCASEIHATFRALQDKLVRTTKGSPAGLKERVQERQTAYKLVVADRERRKREEEAARLRAIELEAQRKREEEEARVRAVEAARRAEAEAIERAAREAARQAELEASRKRNEENRIAAEARAAEARRLADEAAAKRREQEAVDVEARRIRDEAARVEADKLADERAKAEAAATVKDADLTRSRGARGGVSSLTQFWDFRDIDRANLDLESLRSHISHDALEVAVRSYIKVNKERLDSGHQIKGVTFFRNAKTGGR